MPRSRQQATALLVGLIAAATVGCGSQSSHDSGRASVNATLGQAIAAATTPTSPTARRVAASALAAGHAQRPEAIRVRPTPPPASPRSRAILAVANRFARAYLQYQIGRDSPAVSQTIKLTCTALFAHRLLDQPAHVPAVDRSNPTYEPAAITHLAYTGSAAIAPGPPVQIVIAAYYSIEHPSVRGQLTIHLTATLGGWRVADLG
jgi:hypothetical protein